MAPSDGTNPSAAAAPTSPVAPLNRFVPPGPDELAHHFPLLEIYELLGQGGMGAVYKARQRRLDRLVALKILPPDVAGQPTFAERFTREAQALARLNHPHIVTLHDFGESGGLYYFLMEYVDGVNLRQMISGGKLAPREALAIVPQVCDALQYAHDEGVVHRDIKPENILVDRKGRVKIADFGLVKLMRPGDKPAGRSAFTLTGSQQVMGTPHYMAPEQMERPQEVDHRADIYSLGVVFYEMLTGELPLGRFAPPSRRVQIDVRLDEVVLRSLEKEPERRYQRASEVQSDVERISLAPLGPSSADAVIENGLDEVPGKDVKRPVTRPAGAGLLAGALGCLIVAFVVGCIACVLLVLAYLPLQKSPQASSAPPTASEAEVQSGPIERGNRQKLQKLTAAESPPSPIVLRPNWDLGPDGPTLRDGFAQFSLGLEPRQIADVTSVLRMTYSEALALEQRYTERHTDDSGHVVITIKPCAGPVAKLEDRLWSQLDAILNRQQQQIARLNLNFESQAGSSTAIADLVKPGLFGWAKQGARIELWRVGSWYHWNVQGRGYHHSDSAAELPLEYRRFWPGSPQEETDSSGTGAG